MTIALCTNCGELKHGAWCTCPACKSVGLDGEISILLSDHNLFEAELSQIGDAVRVIHDTGLDEDMRFHLLTYFLSKKWPKLLEYDIDAVEPELQKNLDALYRSRLSHLAGQVDPAIRVSPILERRAHPKSSVLESVTMEKAEILGQIAQLIESQEDAIQQHPTEVAALYVKCRDAFLEGQRRNARLEGSQAVADELLLAHRYMLSSSFISAWYHLRGDKANRDKAAQSCSTVIACLGIDPLNIMAKYIEYEKSWRRSMKSEGVTPGARGLAILFVIVIAGALMLFMMR